MSFVIATAESKVKQPDIPGPGEYEVENKRPNKDSCAPFNSSCPRAQSVKKEETPGPSQYKDINVNQVYNHRQEAANVFKSKVPRFKDPPAQPIPKPNNLGSDRRRSAVSDEEQLSIKHSKKIRIQQPSNQMLSIIRNSNNKRKAPSIKNPKQFVRIVYNDPHNTQNYISKYVNVDFVNRNVGPGDYDLEQPVADNRGVDWSKSKANRFQQTRSQSVGPGQYHFEEERKSKAKQASSSFASQSIRSHFESLVYKTNIKDLAHLREYIKYKDATPGPGQYQKMETQPAPSTYQFFGSTCQRFQETREKMYSSIQPGPGHYQPDLKTVHKKKAERIRMHTRSMLDHHPTESASKDVESRRNLKNITPGPADYSSSTNTLQDFLFEKFKRGYRGEFGTREPRFRQAIQQKKAVPGPGQYSFSQSKEIYASTSYIAESKRVEPTNKKLDTPFGEYNVEVYDLAKVCSKKREFLENLRKIDVVRPPFESAVERFRTVTEPAAVDPTLSQIHMLSQAYNRKRKLLKMEPRDFTTSNFKGSNRRFNQEVQDIPPPGYYDPPRHLEKPSYNVKYGYKQQQQPH